MGARYYQPASGRFTQLDPHPGQLLTVNRFAYVGCNPTNGTDPTGLFEDSDVAQGLACGLSAASFGIAAEFGLIYSELLTLAALGLVSGGVVVAVLAFFFISLGLSFFLIFETCLAF